MLELGRRWAGDARPPPGTAELPPEPSGEDFQEFSPTHVRRCDSRLDFVRAFRQASFNAEGQGEQGIGWFRSADGAPVSCRDVITPPPQFKDAPDDGVEWSQLTGDRQREPSESDWSQVSAAFSSSSSSSSPLLAQCDYAPWPAGKVVSICPPATHAGTRHLLGRSTSAHQNRGFLLHHKLRRPITGLYRGGRKYDVLRPIHGSASGTVPAVYWVSPWRTEAADEDRGDPEAEGRPTSLWDESAWDSDVDMYVGEEDADYEGDCEDEVDEEASAPPPAAPAQYLQALLDVFPVLWRGQWTGGAPGLTDGQRQHLPGAHAHICHIYCHYKPKVALLKGVSPGEALGDAHARTPEPRTPEPRDDPPSCFSSSSQASLKDSERSSDDGSSGVFSSDGGHEESWGRAREPPSRPFEGVHIWIEDARGRRLKIRERRWVRVGHVAVGIGREMSASAFTLEMPDRKSVCFRRQIGESHLRLRCVDAPNSCPRWTWRVQDGKLEVRQ
ncbi:uncharacterized protein LOC133142798 isoform X2 [Syngnathus typhle]|uniref:uncharacterized protein LOC133142798 isoform X2 n=1 Tax=Syngnathus typhle TaxID=161592 RepID=UPI002A6A2033|nr:uncharacterized protein LOC133142798 isoform X2 [Syngnathus typhle]